MINRKKHRSIFISPVVKIIFLLFFLFQQVHVRAQLMDTVAYSLHQRPKFFLTLASFNTFIDGQYANIGGARTGLVFNQRVRFGIGYFNLTNNSVVTPIHIQENDLDYVTNGQLYLNFFSLSAEYIFYTKYPWQFTVMPFNLGLGGGKYEYVKRPENKKTFTPTETIIFYQPEVTAQYSVFRWIGVGVTTGYRFTLYRSLKETKGLNAPIFAIDIRLFVDAIYQMIFEGESPTE